MIDEIVARYEEARTAVQTKLTDGLDITGWVDKHDGRQSVCANQFPVSRSRTAQKTRVRRRAGPRLASLAAHHPTIGLPLPRYERTPYRVWEAPELRARGMRWSRIAARLGLPENILRGWIHHLAAR